MSLALAQTEKNPTVNQLIFVTTCLAISQIKTG